RTPIFQGVVAYLDAPWPTAVCNCAHGENQTLRARFWKLAIHAPSWPAIARASSMFSLFYYLPDQHRGVRSARRQPFAIRREQEARDRRVALQLPQQLAGRHFPEADGAVLAGAGEQFAVGREGHGGGLAERLLQAVEFLAGRGVPDAEVA